jgi:hypothetical protein
MEDATQAILDTNTVIVEGKSYQRTRCEIWTRVMGYFRPVSNFNTGKKAEHYGRKQFSEAIASNREFSEKFSD